MLAAFPARLGRTSSVIELGRICQHEIEGVVHCEQRISLGASGFTPDGTSEVPACGFHWIATNRRTRCAFGPSRKSDRLQFVVYVCYRQPA